MGGCIGTLDDEGEGIGPGFFGSEGGHDDDAGTEEEDRGCDGRGEFHDRHCEGICCEE